MTESERLWQEIEAMGIPFTTAEPKPASSSWASFRFTEPKDALSIVADKVLPEHVGALMTDDWSGLVGRYIRTVKDKEGAYWHELELVAQGPGTGIALGSIYRRMVNKVRKVKE